MYIIDSIDVLWSFFIFGEVLNMEISNIQIMPTRPQNGLLAFASFDYGGMCHSNIAIHSDLKNGDYRLVYPTKRLKNGAELRLFYPIDNRLGVKLRQALSNEYRRIMDI